MSESDKYDLIGKGIQGFIVTWRKRFRWNPSSEEGLH